MKVINPIFIKNIMSSHDANNLQDSADQLDDIQMSTSSDLDNVLDKTIPVDFSLFREMHSVEVKANVTVPLHSHDSPVFRLITEGEMTLNKTLYKANDWMVVPKGTKYSITSGPKGYKAKCWCIIWNEK